MNRITIKTEAHPVVSAVVEQLPSFESFNSSTYDVVIVGRQADNKVFAHRVALASVSPILSLIFRDHGWCTNCNKEDVLLILPDFHIDVIRQVLRLLYAGEVSSQSPHEYCRIVELAHALGIDRKAIVIKQGGDGGDGRGGVSIKQSGDGGGDGRSCVNSKKVADRSDGGGIVVSSEAVIVNQRGDCGGDGRSGVNSNKVADRSDGGGIIVRDKAVVISQSGGDSIGDRKVHNGEMTTSNHDDNYAGNSEKIIPLVTVSDDGVAKCSDGGGGRNVIASEKSNGEKYVDGAVKSSGGDNDDLIGNVFIGRERNNVEKLVDSLPICGDCGGGETRSVNIDSEQSCGDTLVDSPPVGGDNVNSVGVIGIVKIGKTKNNDLVSEPSAIKTVETAGVNDSAKEGERREERLGSIDMNDVSDSATFGEETDDGDTERGQSKSHEITASETAPLSLTNAVSDTAPLSLANNSELDTDNLPVPVCNAAESSSERVIICTNSETENSKNAFPELSTRERNQLCDPDQMSSRETEMHDDQKSKFMPTEVFLTDNSNVSQHSVCVSETHTSTDNSCDEMEREFGQEFADAGSANLDARDLNAEHTNDTEEKYRCSGTNETMTSAETAVDSVSNVSASISLPNELVDVCSAEEISVKDEQNKENSAPHDLMSTVHDQKSVSNSFERNTAANDTADDRADSLCMSETLSSIENKLKKPACESSKVKPGAYVRLYRIPDPSKYFICEICGAQRSDKKALLKHMQNHISKRPLAAEARNYQSLLSSKSASAFTEEYEHGRKTVNAVQIHNPKIKNTDQIHAHGRETVGEAERKLRSSKIRTIDKNLNHSLSHHHAGTEAITKPEESFVSSANELREDKMKDEKRGHVEKVLESCDQISNKSCEIIRNNSRSEEGMGLSVEDDNQTRASSRSTEYSYLENEIESQAHQSVKPFETSAVVSPLVPTMQIGSSSTSPNVTTVVTNSATPEAIETRTIAPQRFYSRVMNLATIPSKPATFGTPRISVNVVPDLNCRLLPLQDVTPSHSQEKNISASANVILRDFEEIEFSLHELSYDAVQSENKEPRQESSQSKEDHRKKSRAPDHVEVEHDHNDDEMNCSPDTSPPQPNRARRRFRSVKAAVRELSSEKVKSAMKRSSDSSKIESESEVPPQHRGVRRRRLRSEKTGARDTSSENVRGINWAPDTAKAETESGVPLQSIRARHRTHSEKSRNTHEFYENPLARNNASPQAGVAHRRLRSGKSIEAEEFHKRTQHSRKRHLSEPSPANGPDKMELMSTNNSKKSPMLEPQFFTTSRLKRATIPLRKCDDKPTVIVRSQSEERNSSAAKDNSNKSPLEVRGLVPSAAESNVNKSLEKGREVGHSAAATKASKMLEGPGLMLSAAENKANKSSIGGRRVTLLAAATKAINMLQSQGLTLSAAENNANKSLVDEGEVALSRAATNANKMSVEGPGLSLSAAENNANKSSAEELGVGLSAAATKANKMLEALGLTLSPAEYNANKSSVVDEPFAVCETEFPKSYLTANMEKQLPSDKITETITTGENANLFALAQKEEPLKDNVIESMKFASYSHSGNDEKKSSLVAQKEIPSLMAEGQDNLKCSSNSQAGNDGKTLSAEERRLFVANRLKHASIQLPKCDDKSIFIKRNESDQGPSFKSNQKRKRKRLTGVECHHCRKRLANDFCVRRHISTKHSNIQCNNFDLKRNFSDKHLILVPESAYGSRMIIEGSVATTVETDDLELQTSTPKQCSAVNSNPNQAEQPSEIAKTPNDSGDFLSHSQLSFLSTATGRKKKVRRGWFQLLKETLPSQCNIPDHTNEDQDEPSEVMVAQVKSENSLGPADPATIATKNIKRKKRDRPPQCGFSNERLVKQRIVAANADVHQVESIATNTTQISYENLPTQAQPKELAHGLTSTVGRKKIRSRRKKKWSLQRNESSQMDNEPCLNVTLSASYSMPLLENDEGTKRSKRKRRFRPAATLYHASTVCYQTVSTKCSLPREQSGNESTIEDGNSADEIQCDPQPAVSRPGAEEDNRSDLLPVIRARFSTKIGSVKRVKLHCVSPITASHGDSACDTHPVEIPSKQDHPVERPSKQAVRVLEKPKYRWVLEKPKYCCDYPPSAVQTCGLQGNVAESNVTTPSVKIVKMKLSEYCRSNIGNEENGKRRSKQQSVDDDGDVMALEKEYESDVRNCAIRNEISCEIVGDNNDEVGGNDNSTMAELSCEFPANTNQNIEINCETAVESDVRSCVFRNDDIAEGNDNSAMTFAGEDNQNIDMACDEDADQSVQISFDQSNGSESNRSVELDLGLEGEENGNENAEKNAGKEDQHLQQAIEKESYHDVGNDEIRESFARDESQETIEKDSYHDVERNKISQSFRRKKDENVADDVGRGLDRGMENRLVEEEEAKDNEIVHEAEDATANEVVVEDATDDEVEVVVEDTTDNKVVAENATDNEVVIEDATDNEAEVVVEDATDNEVEVVVEDATDNEVEVVVEDATDNEAEVVVEDATDNEAEVMVEDATDNEIVHEIEDNTDNEARTSHEIQNTFDENLDSSFNSQDSQIAYEWNVSAAVSQDPNYSGAEASSDVSGMDLISTVIVKEEHLSFSDEDVNCESDDFSAQCDDPQPQPEHHPELSDNAHILEEHAAFQSNDFEQNCKPGEAVIELNSSVEIETEDASNARNYAKSGRNVSPISVFVDQSRELSVSEGSIFQCGICRVCFLDMSKYLNHNSIMHKDRSEHRILTIHIGSGSNKSDVLINQLKHLENESRRDLSGCGDQNGMLEPNRLRDLLQLQQKSAATNPHTKQDRQKSAASSEQNKQRSARVYTNADGFKSRLTIRPSSHFDFNIGPNQTLNDPVAVSAARTSLSHGSQLTGTKNEDEPQAHVVFRSPTVISAPSYSQNVVLPTLLNQPQTAQNVTEISHKIEPQVPPNVPTASTVHASQFNRVRNFCTPTGEETIPGRRVTFQGPNSQNAVRTATGPTISSSLGVSESSSPGSVGKAHVSRPQVKNTQVASAMRALQISQCSQCYKMYSCKKELRRHFARVHAPDGKLPCDLCGGSADFAENDLATHKKVRHGLCLYHCGECSFTTNYRAAISSHCRTHGIGIADSTDVSEKQ